MYQEFYNNLKQRVQQVFDSSTGSGDAPSVATPAVEGTERLQAGRQRRGIFERQRQSADAETEAMMEEQPQGADTEGYANRQTAFMRMLEEESEKFMQEEEQRGAEFVGAFGADGAEFDAPPSTGLGGRRAEPRSGDGFIGLIDRHEGGGDYSALLGFSNRSHFSDIDVTNMTLEQIDRFAKGPYAQWSKQWKRQNNHGNPDIPSTPMGRYQFVNTTLQDRAKRMGLDPKTTRFTPAVQDAMFEHYLSERLSRANTMAGKRQQLRSAWEGFRNVPDARLDEAIRQFSQS